MLFVSVTRLRVRSLRFLLPFYISTFRALRQVKRAPGFEAGRLLADKKRVFWTMTAWQTEEAMRCYMNSGAHKAVMPNLLNWSDEALVAHWTQPEPELPSWLEADRRIRESGRASKVRHPNAHHATPNFDPPHTARTTLIRRARSGDRTE